MNIIRKRHLATAALLLMCGSVSADDIDLFVDANSNAAGDLPNVLIVVDNTANWNSLFSKERKALSDIFNSLQTNLDGSARFNVGVMFAAEKGNGNSNVLGGYVRAAIRPMTKENAKIYANMIDALDSGYDSGSGGESSMVFAEAHRYFSSGAMIAGDKIKADYAGNSTSGWSPSYSNSDTRTTMQAVYALPGNARASKGSNTYTGPDTDGCAKNFIIYLSNGPANDNANVIKDSIAVLKAANNNQSIAQFALSPTGSSENVMDEWAYFMKQRSPLSVTTYTIEVEYEKIDTGQGPGWSALLKNAADQGGGTYDRVSEDEIYDALANAFSRIQGVNTVFASVSLPVSVNTQGTYLNQVFVGMFRPDTVAKPRWNGNLKQYKLGEVNNSLKLLDANEVQAINTSTGFIQECARSFWTPTAADTYWSFRPLGDCIPPANLAADTYRNSNFPDGNVVEKGGQGYTRRSNATRPMKTCSPTFGSCTALTDFDTTNASITQASLGAVNAAERTALINWGRGVDIDDENGNGNITEMRPSVHGDVVHSRPVALNFGTDANPEVIVFYGGNDGVFRAINGNRSNAIDSMNAGHELFSFMPPEFYGNIKRLRDNEVKISFPGITVAPSEPTPKPKPYGVDGVITAHTSGSEKWIYATMRRGGRAVYAFSAELDGSGNFNMDLKWKVGCPTNLVAGVAADDTGCTTGFTGIGQTWSAVRVFNVDSSIYSDPLLIFGGGYDPCEDSDPSSCTTGTTKGNKVYILDADTGTRLNTLNTDYAVIADVAIAPDLVTGVAKYGYVADLGGNVYRIDMTSGTPSTWTIVKIASLGCAPSTTCVAKRKFMYAPDIVEWSGMYYLMLGSGDREKPLPSYVNAYGVTNYFFMLKDKPSDATWLTNETTNCTDAVICLNSLQPITTGTATALATLDTKKGWYLGLDAHEQVVTSAITIFGEVTFSTHIPHVAAAGQCASELGTTRLYNVDYRGVSSSFTTLPPVGLPPSPVAGMVTLDDGTTVPFCIGCSPDSPLEADEPTPPTSTAPAQTKNRVYWYIRR